MSVDYRRILQAYLEHVMALEGTDFLHYPVEGLSEAERDALVDVVNAASEADDAKAEAFKRKWAKRGER